jgi:hypothetical protein
MKVMRKMHKNPRSEHHVMSVCLSNFFTASIDICKVCSVNKKNEQFRVSISEYECECISNILGARQNLDSRSS